jgi:translation elongation factor EF-G
MESARVAFVVEPADDFEVVVAVPTMSQVPEYERFIDWSIFGFLDVVMLAEPYPIRNVRVTIVEVEVDPVSSSMMAFRHAGRDAGRKFLEMRRSS